VVFDADGEAAVECDALYLDGLLEIKDEGFDGEDVLVVFEGGLDDAIVELVGDGDNVDVAGGHGGDDLLEEVGEGVAG
jgi:hypothetical protein